MYGFSHSIITILFFPNQGSVALGSIRRTSQPWASSSYTRRHGLGDASQLDSIAFSVSGGPACRPTMCRLGSPTTSWQLACSPAPGSRRFIGRTFGRPKPVQEEQKRKRRAFAKLGFFLFFNYLSAWTHGTDCWTPNDYVYRVRVQDTVRLVLTLARPARPIDRACVRYAEPGWYSGTSASPYYDEKHVIFRVPVNGDRIFACHR